MGRTIAIDSSENCIPQFRLRNLLCLLLLLSRTIVTYLLPFDESMSLNSQTATGHDMNGNVSENRMK